MSFTNSIASKCQGQFQVTGLDANGYQVGVSGGLTPTAGQVTCTSNTVAYQLSATSVPCKQVLISPSPAAGTLYVGSSQAGVQATPPLAINMPSGTQPLTIQVSDVSQLWVLSTVNGDKVGWMALN